MLKPDNSETYFQRWQEIRSYGNLLEAQRKALEAGLLRSNDNYVVIAPTASGKTGIAELAVVAAVVCL